MEWPRGVWGASLVRRAGAAAAARGNAVCADAVNGVSFCPLGKLIAVSTGTRHFKSVAGGADSDGEGDVEDATAMDANRVDIFATAFSYGDVGGT